MNKRAKIVISISILFNIIFIVCVCGFIYKKGGIDYLRTKLSLVSGNNVEYDNYYLDRKDLFEKLTATENIRGKIVFLGDSLTDKCEWSELLGINNTINRGINGDTTDGVLNRIDSIIALEPTKVFIMIGTNDIGRGESKDSILKNYDDILKSLKNNSPDTEVYIESILPVIENPDSKRKNKDITDINKELEILSNKYNYTYINLYDNFLENEELKSSVTIDGLHLNGQGYGLWGGEIKKYINL